MTLSFKIIFLLLASLSQHVGIKPPNPPISKDDIVSRSHGTWFEKNPRRWARIRGSFSLAYLIAECIVLLLPTGSPFLSIICPRSESTPLAFLSSLTPSFLLGVFLMTSGAALRLWCYKTLGTLFTFEVNIQRDHKLVTSGPYAYVRHPSYTGAVALLVGALVVMCSPNSYVNQCHTMSTSVWWLVMAWFSWQTFVAVSLLGRGRTEDEGLKAAFGQSWVQYSHAVPCKFVPGVV